MVASTISRMPKLNASERAESWNMSPDSPRTAKAATAAPAATIRDRVNRRPLPRFAASPRRFSMRLRASTISTTMAPPAITISGRMAL